MSSSVIAIRDLSKWYGEVIGLAGFSTDIEPGVTGLLGPNGAGKSTLLKCLSGLLRPDRGSVRVLGEHPFANHTLFRRVGICPESDPFYEDMRGGDYLARVARWAGYSRRDAQAQATRALERVGMAHDGIKPIAGMSKGMRQRIKFAQAILHEPEILLLDEPMTGMDPVQRRCVHDLVAEYERTGRTVLVSSHILHEVEALTDRVLLLRNGRLLAEGTVGEIRDHFEDVPRRIHILAANPRAVASAALELETTAGVQLRAERGVHIETRHPEGLLAHLTSQAAAGVLEIHEIFPADEDLAAVFGLLES